MCLFRWDVCQPYICILICKSIALATETERQHAGRNDLTVPPAGPDDAAASLRLNRTSRVGVRFRSTRGPIQPRKLRESVASHATLGLPFPQLIHEFSASVF